MPVNRGHGDVERFASSGKMDLVFPTLLAVFKNLFQKAPDRLADRHDLIQGKEAMAVEFDKDPLRASAHADVRSAPAAQPGQIQRVILREHAVVEARHRKSPDAAPPVENERSGK